MDPTIEVLSDSRKIYVACRFAVWPWLCGSSINLYLNYFSRKTETLGSVGPAHDPINPIRPMLCGRCPRSFAAELSFSTKLRACSYLEAVSLLVEKSLLVLCFVFVLFSPVVPWHLEHSTQLIVCLSGVSMSTCKISSQAHGLQTRPYK